MPVAYPSQGYKLRNTHVIKKNQKVKTVEEIDSACNLTKPIYQA
jgi:hypothetical protein